jgi:hypothetical protein
VPAQLAESTTVKLKDSERTVKVRFLHCLMCYRFQLPVVAVAGQAVSGIPGSQGLMALPAAAEPDILLQARTEHPTRLKYPAGMELTVKVSPVDVVFWEQRTISVSGVVVAAVPEVWAVTLGM